MNKILEETAKVMNRNLKEYLPDVDSSELEGNGSIYYMNGKNGTEFDWYVNDKLSDFMMFYNDKENMGAMKATLYKNGALLIYVYGDRGKSIAQEISTRLEVSEQELQSLSALLRNEADDKKIWDADIEQIDSELELSREQLEDFLSNAHYYDEMRAHKKLLNQFSYVSKRIIEEGWKVGYMCRDAAMREQDSGWAFMAGNEEDSYMSDYHNIMLMRLYEVLQLDPDVKKYIDYPVGTGLIRISSEEFEVDQNNKEIYMEKRGLS